MPASERPDTVVIGAGHNGLVCACYLARAGQRVLVVERRADIGGCTRTIPFPGAAGTLVNTCADVDIFFHGGPVPRELDLASAGLEMLTRDVAYFVPFRDGRSVFLSSDLDATVREIRKLSRHDAAAWPGFMDYWEEVFRRLEPVEQDVPPAVGGLAEALGGDRLAEELMQLMIAPPRVAAEAWFESPEMLGILAWQTSLYGASPDTPGTGLGIGHLPGSIFAGIQRPRGGTGALCAALRRRLESFGGAVRTGAAVRRIALDDGGAAVGVVLEDDTRIACRTVIASIDAKRVFRHLIEPAYVTDDLRRTVAGITVQNVGTYRLSIAVDGPLAFAQRYELDARAARLALEASPILNADTWGTVADGWKQITEARVREDGLNTTWVGVPTAMDTTLAPSGWHVVSFAEYAPYDLAQGTWEEVREQTAERIIEEWERYCPGTRARIRARWTQTPTDLHRETGNLMGNPFHIDQSAYQSFGMRPAPGLARYATPFAGLYLSGSGTHPGGGVTGLPGRNAATVVIEGAQA